MRPLVLAVFALFGCRIPDPPDEQTPRCPTDVGINFPVGDSYAVTAPGPGVESEIRIIEESGVEVTRFLAFGPEYTGGITLANGDVNGDRFPDLIVGTLEGPSRLRVFDGEALDEVELVTRTLPDNVVLVDVYPFGRTSEGGLAIAAGRFDTDRIDDVVVSQTTGRADFRVFDGVRLAATERGAELDTDDAKLVFEPFGAGFTRGLNVAIGDVDCDAGAEIVAIAASGSPRVALVDVLDNGNVDPVGEFTAFANLSVNGGTVAVGDVDDDRSDDIIIGAGPGGPPQVEVYAGLLTSLGVAPSGDGPERILSAPAFDTSFRGGVTVAAIESGEGVADIAVAQTSGGTEIRLVDGADLSQPAARPSTGAPWGTVETDGEADGARAIVSRFDELRITPPDPVSSLAVVGAGPGVLPVVGVFDRNGVQRGNFLAFPPFYLGGVEVAGADFNGDGIADIVAGAGTGAAQVRVIDGARLAEVNGTTGEIASSAVLSDFFAFAATYTGGIDVATGDVNGDGTADIIVGAATGLGQVRVIDGTRVTALSGVVDNSDATAILADFFAFAVDYADGIRLAAGDVDGDDTDDIAVGTKAGISEVRVVDGDQAPAVDGVVEPTELLADFQPFGISDTAGVHLAVGDLTGDGSDDVAVGTGDDALSIVRTYDGASLVTSDDATALLSDVTPFGSQFFGGAMIAMSPGFDGNADLGLMARMGDDPALRIFEGSEVVTESGRIDRRAVLAEFTPFVDVVLPDLAFVEAPEEEDDQRR